MALVIERIRALHEDIERAEQKITNLLLEDPKGHKERLITQHQINYLLSFIRERQEELASRYADEDQSKKEETNSIVGEGPALFSAFYGRLKDTREYHRKFPGGEVGAGDGGFRFAEVKFSGEESGGRYLDLHEFYDLFINLGRLRGVMEKGRGEKGSSFFGLFFVFCFLFLFFCFCFLFSFLFSFPFSFLSSQSHLTKPPSPSSHPQQKTIPNI